MSNGLALVIVALYLLIVLYRGKWNEFTRLASDSKGFVFWAAAIILWYAIQERLPDKVKGLGYTMAATVTIGLLLRNVDAIPAELKRTAALFGYGEAFEGVDDGLGAEVIPLKATTDIIELGNVLPFTK